MLKKNPPVCMEQRIESTSLKQICFFLPATCFGNAKSAVSEKKKMHKKNTDLKELCSRKKVMYLSIMCVCVFFYIYMYVVN